MLSTQRCALFYEALDHLVECFGLFAVAKMAGLVDDVHFGHRGGGSNEFEKIVAAS